MKKFWILLLPVFIAPSISACQDKAHSIIPIHTTFNNSKLCSLNFIEFENIMESGQQFAIEFYSPYCSHCEELNPKLEKYVEETNNLIYRLDLTTLTDRDVKKFTEKYPTVLPDTYVPAIRFVSDKQLTYEVENTKFESYSKLRRSLNQHFLTSRINIVTSDFSYSSFLANYSTFIVCRYNLIDEKSLNFVSKNLITNEMYKKDIPVLLLNSSKFDQNQYYLIADEYIHMAGSNDFIAMVKDGKKIKAADFLASDFDFNSFIS